MNYLLIISELQYFISALMNNEIPQREHLKAYKKFQKCRSLQNLKMFARSPSTVQKQEFLPKKPAPCRYSNLLKDFIEIEHMPKSPQIQKCSAKVGLQRVKSVASIKSSVSRQNGNEYEELIEIYKSQNQNLKEQNKFLVKELKKQKKNEESLCQYIEQLRKQITKIQSKDKSFNPQNQENEINGGNIPKYGKLSDKLYNEEEQMHYWKENELIKGNTDTFYSSKLSGNDDYSEEGQQMFSEMEELASRFNYLMEQCSQAESKKTRESLREKLAETAHKMKLYRKQFSQ